METIHVTFDELTEHTASGHTSSGPSQNLLSPGPISSGLVQNSNHVTPYVSPTCDELKKLFDPMFDEYFESQPPHEPVQPAIEPNIMAGNAPHDTNGPLVSISLNLEAPECSNTQIESNIQSSSEHQGVTSDYTLEVNPFAPPEEEPFENIFAP